MNNNKKRRVTCVRKHPTNELFKFWLEELRDRAVQNGLKTQYVYGKALNSVRACPLPLESAEDAKKLDNVGEKIVKVLGDKLRDFIDKYGEPTFENIGNAGVATDANDGKNNDDGGPAPKRNAKRQSKPREYIPGYRTGGYAIIRALYDAYKKKDNENSDDGANSAPYIGKQKLQGAAQFYCDESLTTATKDSPYTAWNSVKTLIKHDLVRMTRASGSSMQYALTETGIAMGKRLTDAANGTVDGSFNDQTPGSVALTQKSPVARKRQKGKTAEKKETKRHSPTDTTSIQKSPSPAPFGCFEVLRSCSSTVSKTTIDTASIIRRSPSPVPSDELEISRPCFSTISKAFDSPPQRFRFWDKGNLGDAADMDPDAGTEFPPLADSPPMRHYFGKKPTQLGYIYLDSDGLETQEQEKAYVWIDDSTATLWYLVKTTDAYVSTTGRTQWRSCDDLPVSIRNIFLNDDFILMLIHSDFADDMAPGIFGTANDVEAVADERKQDLTAGLKATSTRSVDTQDRTEPLLHGKEAKNAKEFLAVADTFPSTSAVRFDLWHTKNVQTSAVSSTSAAGVRTLPSDVTVLEPGTFEIILLIDYGESVGGIPMFGEKTNRKEFLTKGLRDLKVDYIERRLPVGDYLFIARSKASGAGTSGNGGQGAASRDNELVLGPIIERKRMDDLAASIKDSRFHEQKQRLRNCGVDKVIYLIEDFGRSMGNFGMNETALRSAMIGTQVCDGFDVIRKKNPVEVASYLANLLSHLREKFQCKRLVSRQPDSLPIEELIELGSEEIALPTFKEFSEVSAKRRPLTVGDAFARCLLLLPGMSSERADAVRKVFPTLKHLIEAYEACNGDESKENALLESIPCGHLGRKLGAEISKKIARFFCSEVPFTK